MLGSFNKKSLELFQEAMSESMFSDFSEGDSYDFTTCIRPDGSAYGTGGKCRKGTEGKAKEKEAPKRSQVDLVTPQKQGPSDVERMKKYLKDESDKLKNLNDAQKQNPSRSNDPDVVSRKKVLERNIAAVEKQLKAQTKKVSSETPYRVSQEDVDRTIKIIDGEKQKLQNLNDSVKKNPELGKDPEMQKQRKALEATVKSYYEALVYIMDRQAAENKQAK